MALTNNANIKDIITELKNMQMINGKAEVTNVLGSPFTATDNPTQIVDKIQVLKTNMANDLTNNKSINSIGTESLNELVSKFIGFNGKRWASGEFSLASQLTVDNLTFRPSIVIAWNEGDNTQRDSPAHMQIILDTNKFMYSIYFNSLKSVQRINTISTTDGQTLDSSNVTSTNGAVSSSYSRVTNNGFILLSFSYGNIKPTNKWIAYE